MWRPSKKDKKEKTKTSNAREIGSGLIEKTVNSAYQHDHPTLPSTSTAVVQMQAVPGPSSSAPKLDVNDVMVSSLDHSGSGPSASTLGHTEATTNPTALEHNRSKKREQSRISSRLTIGQEKAFNEVRDCLTKSEVGMVGIYGMPGVGKTTLMEKVQNEFLEVEPANFKVIRIVVSATVDKDNIQKSLMRELDLTFYEDQDTQTRGMRIKDALFKSKDKVALLLDDIWEVLDLEELGVAGDHRLDTSKFKIIFTTRSEDVCLQMKPDQKMKIECLGPEESWDLFRHCVGDKPFNSHDQIRGLAKEVANECKGLPLALTVIGKAMVCKTSLEAWKNALNRLTEISGAENKLFKCLRYSYDNLENKDERKCFLFCCMYPEDKEIDKDTLVESWIGEGLLDVGYVTYEEKWNRGHSIIDTLVAKSLLEFHKDKYRYKVVRVKMHDVIRDMGLWIGPESNYFVHTASLMLSGDEIARRWNTARWIYVDGHNNDIPQELDCPKLSLLHINCAGKDFDMVGIMNSRNFKCKGTTLIMEYVSFGYSPIPTFSQFVGLRHLEIKYSNLEVLPPDIGNLTKLLVMILVDNLKLSTLPPTIGGLCELRKLQIRNCDDLEIIPSEVGKLIKLEIVDISAPVVDYGGNIFNDCTELRRLHMEVENLTELPNGLLYNCKKLEELCIKMYHPLIGPGRGLFIEGLKRLTSLKVLIMQGCPIADGDEVIFAIGNMRRLRELRITKCDIDKLVIPEEIDFLPQLEELEIRECHQLEKVHFRKRALQSLRILDIRACRRLAHVVGLQHLLRLRELVIADLPDFEAVLITTTDDDGHCLLSDVQTHSASFPNLQRFSLESLWRMKRICNDNVSFPSLSEFRLDDCPKLKKLPRGLMNENMSTTPMISGEIAGTEEWWEGLAWEDDAFKSYLRPLFRASSKAEYPSSTLSEDEEEWWEGLAWEDDAFKSYLRPRFHAKLGFLSNFKSRCKYQHLEFDSGSETFGSSGVQYTHLALHYNIWLLSAPEQN